MKKEISEINKIIGLKLKLKRKESNLSQRQLGKNVGLTFQQIQKYEKGVNNISIANLYKFSKILNTDISYFINNNINNESNIINSIEKTNNNPEIKELNKVIGYYNKIKDKKIRNSVLQLIRGLSVVD